MSAMVADTHAALWFLRQPEKLSTGALAAFDQAASTGDPVHVSAISIVEVRYLVEKARLAPDVLDDLLGALRSMTSVLVVAPLNQAIAEAVQLVPRADVPDMPDRIIAATALHLGLPLITRDNKIRTSAIHTIW